MKPFHIEYDKLINQHNESGLYELSKSISDNLIDKGPGGKYEWYIDLSKTQGEILKELYEERSGKGTLEEILTNIAKEVKERWQVHTEYSKDEFSLYFGNPFVGTRQSIEFRYHSEERDIKPFEKIRIISYKGAVTEMIYSLVRFDWELQKKGLEFI